MDKQRAFTLLEMMVTITLLGLLIGLGLPQFTSFIQKSHAKSVTHSLAKMLSFARHQAVNLSVPVLLCPLDSTQKCSADWKRPVSIFIDDNNNQQLDSGEQLLRQQVLLDGGDYYSMSRQAIRFRSDGTAPGDNFTFVVCPKKASSPYAAALIMSDTGRVYHSSDSDGDGLEDLNGSSLSCQ